MEKSLYYNLRQVC